MIVFDLKCAGDHVFEAWFGSSEAFEEQRGRGLIHCPVCGDSAVAKALMAPAISAKGNRAVTPAAAVAAAQAALLSKSRWVGRRFAEEARAIHDGQRPEALIHGQATADEVRTLLDDGVPIAPLPLPVRPPETLN